MARSDPSPRTRADDALRPDRLVPQSPVNAHPRDRQLLGDLGRRTASSHRRLATGLMRSSKDDTIVLHGKVTSLTSDIARRFITDATRSAEGLCSDDDLKQKYEITPADWKNIAENAALGREIKAEGERRIRSGQRAREAAQQHFVKAPTVLDSIMSDTKASPRHRIESARELRQVAIGGDGAENAPDAGQPFIIRIDLSAAPGGGEVLEIATTANQPKRIETENKIEGELDANG
jgi:hypothetical protein